MREVNRNGGRVLVVDDEPNILSTLKPILEREGYEVDVAQSFRDARTLFEGRRYDAALVDLRLGDADGLQLAASLQARHPGTPVVILTGFASLETALEAIHHHFYDYLTKPADIEQLKRTLRGAVERGQVLQGG